MMVRGPSTRPLASLGTRSGSFSPLALFDVAQSALSRIEWARVEGWNVVHWADIAERFAQGR